MTRMGIVTEELHLQTFDETICAESNVKASGATEELMAKLPVKTALFN